MNKRFLPLVGLALCLLLSGCDMTLMGNKNAVIPYETFDTKPQPEDPTKMLQYNAAMGALADLRYQEALQLFTELGDFKDAAEYAVRFTYIEDTLLCTEQYTNGVLTQTEEVTYDPEGNMVSSAGNTGTLIETLLSDNGNVRRKTWQYKDYFLSISYDAYTHVGVVTREEKRPIFHSANVDAVMEGYIINYVYNYEGKLFKDQGEIQQHTQKSGSTSVSIEKMLFEGKYTYDEEGRLLRYDRHYNWGGGGTSCTIYKYDDQDRVIREESDKEGTVFFGGTTFNRPYKKETTVKEFRYDDAGNQIFFSQLTTTYENDMPPVTTYIQIEYEYENGRLVQETTTFGDDSDTMIETCYIYGDYLGYLIDEEVTGNGG